MDAVACILLDIDGVLHVSGEPIPGAVDAVARLREQGHSLRFVTNNSTRPRAVTSSSDTPSIFSASMVVGPFGRGGCEGAGCGAIAGFRTSDGAGACGHASVAPESRVSSAASRAAEFCIGRTRIGTYGEICGGEF
jgi:hypothetical protein